MYNWINGQKHKSANSQKYYEKNWYVAETLRTNLQTLENTVKNAMLQKLSCKPLKYHEKRGVAETFPQTSKNTMKNAELQKKNWK